MDDDIYPRTRFLRLYSAHVMNRRVGNASFSPCVEAETGRRSISEWRIGANTPHCYCCWFLIPGWDGSYVMAAAGGRDDWSAWHVDPEALTISIESRQESPAVFVWLMTSNLQATERTRARTGTRSNSGKRSSPAPDGRIHYSYCQLQAAYIIRDVRTVRAVLQAVITSNIRSHLPFEQTSARRILTIAHIDVMSRP